MLIPLLLMLQAAVSPLVGEATRPDTDGLWVASFEDSVAQTMFAYFQEEVPNEGLVCLYGRIAEPDTLKLGWVTKAKTDSAGRRWLQPAEDSCEASAGGAAFGGFAHSHPSVLGCYLSGRDVALLDRLDRQALFSMVFCSNGEWEIVWQDGRMGKGTWLSWFARREGFEIGYQ